MITAAIIMAVLSWQRDLPQQSQSDEESIEIVRSDSIAVFLEFQPRASPLDRRWLAFVFENLTDEPLEIADARYRIERFFFDGETGERRSGRSLAYGNTYQLFPEAWAKEKPGPIQVILEPRGVVRIENELSDSATGSLLSNSTRPQQVQATMDFHLTVAEEAPLSNASLDFAFAWSSADESAFDALFNELQDLLASPPDQHHGSADLMRSLLAHPRIGARIGMQQLMKTLDGWESIRQAPRETVLRHLQHHGAAVDPAVVLWCRTRLEGGNIWGLRDIKTLFMWDDSFVEPLVQMVEEQQQYWWIDALRMLDEHPDPWRHDPAIVARLNAAVLARLEPSALAADPAVDPDPWLRAANMLAMTRDPAHIPFLARGLDVTSLITEIPRSYANPMAIPVRPPARVCDVALNGILQIQYGESEEGYSWGRVRRIAYLRDDAAVEEAVMQLRDEMIAQLKRDLEEGRIDVPPIGDQ